MTRLARCLLLTSTVAVLPSKTAIGMEGPPTVVAVPAPTSDDSAFPQLAADGRGGVYMTWLETLKGGAGHRLRLSHRPESGSWEEPATVHEGKDFWRNWADFPGLGVFADGSVMVHWLARSGDAVYDYDIKARISRDGGKSFGDPFLVNTDGVTAEHGFVSFAATEQGMALVWLDGRATKGGHEGGHATGGGAMTLRYGEFLSDGTRVHDLLLDSRVCDCCQTALVNTSKGLLAAYRDRSAAEFRDISLVRPLAAKIQPREFSKDGWKIQACPVNGPALASRSAAVTAVWFTTAGGKARLRAAASTDGGDTFSRPVEVDSASPLGRVDAAILPSGASLITWLERGVSGSADIKGAFLDAQGALQSAFTVATISMARASGFPRLEIAGDEAVFAWTEIQAAPPDSPTRAAAQVRTAVMKLK